MRNGYGVEEPTNENTRAIWVVPSPSLIGLIHSRRSEQRHQLSNDSDLGIILLYLRWTRTSLVGSLFGKRFGGSLSLLLECYSSLNSPIADPAELHHGLNTSVP